MARPERYFIGPSMKNKLRDVIQRLGDSPLGGEGGADIPVRLQSLVRAGNSIRAATFSGSWPIGSTAVVTLTNTGSTSSPTVASTLVTATNTLYPITATDYSNEACIVGQDSGKWYLVATKQEDSIRAATFSGSWPIGSTVNVTFTQAPTAIVSATNTLWPLDASNPSSTPCLVGREGSSWRLIAPRLSLLSCDTRASGQQLSFFSG